MSLLENKKVIHAGTYNGYPLGSAAVHATFEILSRNNGAALRDMYERTEVLHQILIDSAETVGLPLIVQGPTGLASFHCSPKPLEHPAEYDFEVMAKDIIVATALQRHGVLVSSISRIYPNIQLSDADLEYFDHHVPLALREAKATIDEIY
jgi:hypothetical protein